MKQQFKLSSPAIAMVLLFSLFAFFLILTPIMSGLLSRTTIKPEAVIKITMVIQDVLVFILPAIIVALASTRLPARFLGLDTLARPATFALALVTLICAIPALNAVVEWNQNLHLPESMRGIEDTMRQLEENARTVTESLMKGSSVASLIVSVLIVGVLAGFSEELFFRGAFQRTLLYTNINQHVGVWIVAVVFSLFHFQMFGFVPRMLLGAYFGYLMLWSGSIWVPMLVHVANNSIVVIDSWRVANNPDSFNLDAVGTDFSTPSAWIMIVISIILTALCLRLTYRSCKQ